MLLDTEGAVLFPQVVGVGEHSDPARDGLHDASDSDGLLALTRDGNTIGGTGRWPTSLKNPTYLSRTGS